MADWPVGYFMPGGAGYQGSYDNPFYGSRDTAQYSRYDETAGRGVNIPNIASYKQARDVYETYQNLKPGQKGSENAQRFNETLKHNTGISDWNKASDEQLFNALDDTFGSYMEDNKKENFGIGDIGGLLSTFVAPAVGIATGQPWLSGLLGAGIGGATGGLKGAALGGLGGAAAGYFSPGYGPFSPTSAIGTIGGAGDALQLGLDAIALNPAASAGGAFVGAGLGSAGQFAANAVPGLRTGVTTPAGGGLTTQQGAGLGYAPGPGQPTAIPGGHLVSSSGRLIDGAPLEAGPFARGTTQAPIQSGPTRPPVQGSGGGSNDFLKRAAVNAATNMLSPQQQPAAGGGGMSMPMGGGGGAMTGYQPNMAPLPPALPDYFDFGYNPFGGFV